MFYTLQIEHYALKSPSAFSAIVFYIYSLNKNDFLYLKVADLVIDLA